MAQREEGIDYYAGLSETQKNDAQFLERGLAGLSNSLSKLPDGPQKDALINSYTVSLGLSKGSADFLREVASTPGGSVSASSKQLSTSRSRPPGKSGRPGVPKDWGKLQGAAAFAGIRYTDYRDAVQNPNSTESKAILGDDYGNPKAQQRKLKQLGENAQNLHDRLRDHQKTEEAGGYRYQSATAADLKNYSEGGALGKGLAKKERAAITQKKADWKSNPNLGDEESTISLSEFSNSELKKLNLSETDIATLQNNDSANLGNRKNIYLRVRGQVSGGDKNAPEWANLRERLVRESVARDRRKGGSGRGTGRGKTEKDPWYSRKFNDSFKSLKALDSKGLNTDDEFKNNGFWDDATDELGTKSMRKLISTAVSSGWNLATLRKKVEGKLHKKVN